MSIKWLELQSRMNYTKNDTKIGRRGLAGKEPCERLIPVTTLWSRRKFSNGSGNLWSTWRDRTPDRYTLIEVCRKESTKKVAKRHRVHSVAGYGELEDLTWWIKAKKFMNVCWAEEEVRRVEAGKPWYMKERQRTSRSLWKAELKAVEKLGLEDS